MLFRSPRLTDRLAEYWNGMTSTAKYELLEGIIENIELCNFDILEDPVKDLLRMFADVPEEAN